MGQTVVIEDDRKSEVAGDFVTVYEAHYPRLVRALEIGGLDRPTAEDVAQEAFAAHTRALATRAPRDQPARVRLPHGVPPLAKPLEARVPAGDRAGLPS